MLSTAQANFFELGATGSLYKHSGYNIGGQFNVNHETKSHIHYGAGISGLQFKNANSIYFPVYRILGYNVLNNGLVVGVNIHAGYGLYDDSYSAYTIRVESKGGLFFSPGVTFHGKKTASPYLDFRYTRYQFKSTVNGQTDDSFIDAATVSIGVFLSSKKRN